MEPDGRGAGGGRGVSRRNEGGQVEVLLVHRPHHGDWSFPKGKEAGVRRIEECALREVREETVLLGGSPTSPTATRAGVQRRSATGRMTAGGDAEARNEIDAIRWLGIPVAANLRSDGRPRAARRLRGAVVL